LRLEELGKLNDLIGNRTCDFSGCSIVVQPTTLPRAPKLFVEGLIMYYNEFYASKVSDCEPDSPGSEEGEMGSSCAVRIELLGP
jgi:hypothetical protein